MDKEKAMSFMELMPKDLSVQNIESSFRKLAQKYHPDKGGDPEKFKTLSDAKKYLINSLKYVSPKYPYEYSYKCEYPGCTASKLFIFNYCNIHCPKVSTPPPTTKGQDPTTTTTKGPDPTTTTTKGPDPTTTTTKGQDPTTTTTTTKGPDPTTTTTKGPDPTRKVTVQCKGLTAKGDRCKKFTQTGSYCWLHIKNQ